MKDKKQLKFGESLFEGLSRKRKMEIQKMLMEKNKEPHKECEYFKALDRRIRWKYIKKMIKNDLPILISDKGEIVCIEHSRDVFHIGLVGMRRTGKTLALYGILDRLYNQKKCLKDEGLRSLIFGILNDIHHESSSHVFKNNVPFMKTSLGKMNEKPTGLPISIIPLSTDNTKKCYDYFIRLSKSGSIPCLLNSLPLHRPQDIFSYYLNRILQTQRRKNKIHEKDTMCLFVDGLEEIQTDRSAELLTKCIGEGVFIGTMLFWTAYNFSKINVRTRQNTSCFICFRQYAEEAKAIGKEFCLKEKDIQQLQNLNKDKFEAMVMTKERFRIYNLKNGTITYSDEGAIKGTILFPLSFPKHPAVVPPFTF